MNDMFIAIVITFIITSAVVATGLITDHNKRINKLKETLANERVYSQSVNYKNTVQKKQIEELRKCVKSLKLSVKTLRRDNDHLEKRDLLLFEAVNILHVVTEVTKDKTATVIDVEEQVKKIAPFIKKVQGGVK